MKLHRSVLVYCKALVLLVAIGLTSCSGDPKERGAKEALSALVQSKKNVSVFGHVSIMNILNKLDYKHIPKANVLISSQLMTWKKAFKLDGPMYFAVEGPYAIDGTPETVYGLIDVTGEDSLLSVVQEMGYAMEKTDDFKYFQENDVTFGVRKNLFIILSKKGDYDGKKAIKEAFAATEGDLSDGKTEEIIETEADAVVGVSLERVYSKEAMSMLSKDKQKELAELVADGFTSTAVKFEKGTMTIESKNMFSDELKDRLFFKDGNGDALKGKMGSGNAYMGVSGNIDMKKLEAFVKDFAPNNSRMMGEAMSPEMSFMMMAAGESFMKELSGNFGFVAVGKPKEGMEFEFNAFVGLKKSDGMLAMQAKTMTMGMPQKNGAYIMDNTAIRFKKDGIYVNSITNAGKGKINLPGFANKFGENTFFAFVDFKKMDMKSFDLPKESKVLEIMESVTIECTRDGSTLVLTAKDKSKNMLKLVSDFYYQTFKDEIDNLSMM